MVDLPVAQLLFLHGQVATSLGVSRGVASTDGLAAALREAEASRETGLFERAAALAVAFARHRAFADANLALAAAAAALFCEARALLEALEAERRAVKALRRAARASASGWRRRFTLSSNSPRITSRPRPTAAG